MWKLEIRPVVRDWLRSLRSTDRRLAQQIAQAIQAVLDGGPGMGRPLVDTLTGTTIRNLKEIRQPGTIRILFVFHGGTVLLLLAGGDKRDDPDFYNQMIKQAEIEYAQWQEEGQR